MTVPGSANPLLLRSAAPAAYTIPRSLRFNASDSAFLSRTPASAGNRKTWTYSFWVKRSKLGASQYLFESRTGASDTTIMNLSFNASNQLQVVNYSYFPLISTSVYRDVSAWYHIVWSLDTTQATAANRMKLYVNGAEVTAFGTDSRSSLTQNSDQAINQAAAHYIGGQTYLDGCIADAHLIDGQALTPSSFGEFDTNNVWQPKAYSGTYSGNSFHLDFADNSAATATTLGKDTSGNGNNWTPNNLSVTAGAGNDSLRDSPSSPAGQTDSGAGGTVVGNYATLNPINKNSGLNLLNGNLDATWSSGSALGASATIALPTSGKWYCEITNTGSSGIGYGIGISDSGRQTFTNSGILWGESAGSYYRSNGDIGCDGKSTQTGSTYTTGDIISIAYDAATRKIWFAKNGTWQLSGNPASGTNEIGTLNSPTGNYFFGFAIYDTNTGTANFGQRPFAYTAPSGFKALCTANLPTPTIANGATAMDVKLYTGNGSTQTISGLNFSPDLVWIKTRSAAVSHALQDTVRGTNKVLYSNSTGTEDTYTDALTSFNSDGFLLGAQSLVNNNTSTYAAWCWDAGTSTVTNTQGSITSSVRASASAGFSVATWTGTGANATIGHGCGAAPKFFVIKRRDTSSSWIAWHSGIGSTDILRLESTNAKQTISGFWQGTNPTSTLAYLDSDGTVNANGGTYVGYFWAPVVGYSSFGSYTGNGSSDGPFVFTGMRPKYILIKRTDAAEDWAIRDTSRSPFNASTTDLAANQTYGDFDSTSNGLDILSNGFKPRNTRAMYNASGGTYVWAAFAENPFQYARAR